MLTRMAMIVTLGTLCSTALAQQWDTVIGDSMTIGETDAHWFTLRGRNTTYLVDGDAGEVRGTLTLSNFSPALLPRVDKRTIYAYGSYYTRTYYGDRTDLVIAYDLDTTEPVTEIEIPAKSAGIGHSGMMGLINDRYIGVWNITPGMSVTIVDTETNSFVDEISTPGCAGVYPAAEGFIMACGDGNLQYIGIGANGEETARLRSRDFFNVMEDPVYDYAVASADGWIFMSLEGLVYEATVSGNELLVSEPWTINPPDEEREPDMNGIVIEKDDDWRIGGRQPFAFNPATGVLVTIMHKGGGQETFEDAGTEIWGFSWETKRRGYRLKMEGDTKVASVQMTQDSSPLLLVSPSSGDIQIRDAWSGALIREIKGLQGSSMQYLHPYGME